jgi:curli production assembly/transport component CsgG
MRRLTILAFTLYGVIAAGLGGCAEQRAWWGTPSEGLAPPVLTPVTQANKSLRELPPSASKVAVSVYSFADLTGQMKASDTLQTLSRAVTQGGAAILIKALQDAGGGQWFTVVEREKIEDLQRERRIISETRQTYLGEQAINPQALPPLLFAGILLEGGIIGYDTNTRTGGAGARYLGIGGDITYREHVVTVSLRAISTKTGEVLSSHIVHKTVLSVGIQGNAYKYVGLNQLLESDIGFTKNEPDQIAVQQAIEKTVRTMIVDGAKRNLWHFKDKAAELQLISEYDKEQFKENAPQTAQAEIIINK